MLPADECLDAAHLGGVDVDLGLVVEAELAVGDGVPKIGHQRQVGRVVVVLGLGVAHDPRPGPLGHVHGDVGLLQQVIDVPAVLGGDDVPDARLDRQREAADLHLLLDHLTEPGQHVVRAGHVGEHEAELVATQTGQRVRCPQVGEETLPDRRQQPVAVVVAEGVVDFLELVEIDDGDGRRVPELGATGQFGGGPTVEQAAVRQVGQGIVLGQVGVQPDLASESPDHPERDPEQHHVEEAQPDGQVAVEVAHPLAHVGADRRVREVDLEHPDLGVGRSRIQRQIDLDRLGAGPARVVTVGVDPCQPGHGGTVGGVQSLVLGTLAEAGAVVGEDDVALEIPQPQSLDVIACDGARSQLMEPHRLDGAEAIGQWAAVEYRLDRGLGHEQRLGTSLGQSTSRRLGAVAPGQDQSEHQYRDQGDGGEDRKLPHRRLVARSTVAGHECLSAHLGAELKPFALVGESHVGDRRDGSGRR